MAAPLSAHAARALEQVKMGLFMLYGAAYFTEDEWIKIDGLIHKGQYVFTTGPSNPLEGSFELMSFDDANDKTDLILQTNPNLSFDTAKADAFVVTETQVDSPTNSDLADSTTEPAETSNDTSIEASSDDELPAKVVEADPAMFDFSQWDPPAEPSKPTESSPELANIEKPTNVEETVEETKPFESAEILKREPVERPAAGGLALYTQAQLDEMKAFNQTLTPAGKKGKRTRGSSPSESAPRSETTYAPTPSEHETRIQSWASEVDAQEPLPRAPSPSPTIPMIANDFMKTHGRPPKSINDLVQPNNPEFRTVDRRPLTRNITPVKKAKSSGPQVNVAAGTILIAQGNQVKKSLIELDVRSGDRIRMLKHVSGIVHQAENMRTGIRGQISENVFKKTPHAMKVDPVVEQQRMILQRNSSISSTVGGLDAMERRNAAEWDEVPATNRPKPVAPAKPKPLGGLGASRFAVLDETKSVVSSASDDMVSREEVAKMVDEKFAQLLASRDVKAPTGPRKKPSMNEPLQPVIPKSVTCWFWATPNKSCRFTADECRDIHAFLPPSASSPANLRMGKPSWGALADSIPPPTTAQIQAQIAPSPPLALGQGDGESMKDTVKTFKTCWYWANENCQNTAQTCRYLHEKCAAGVAPKPNTWKYNWSRWGKSEPTDEFGKSWRGEKTDEEEDGELVLETVDDVTDWKEDDEVGWGESAQPQGSSTTWDQDHLNNGWGDPADRYKPPHVKALEEKSLKEQVGW
ncbi:hypothetical protein IFR05_003025 [Cadophora sp. M221]|nr:hypothetical protein IFR05_003025 [Cadophora sp. M221]